MSGSPTRISRKTSASAASQKATSSDLGAEGTGHISNEAAHRQILQARNEAFTDFHLWPVGKVFVREWLANFKPEEQELANWLLQAFQFFNEAMVEALVRASFRNVQKAFLRNLGEKGDAAAWSTWVKNMVICPVEGEHPNVTDSGNLVARKYREVLRFPEEKIITPLQALRMLASDKQDQIRVLFVDDFVGSGSQFTNTIYRVRADADNGAFSQLPAATQNRIFFAPLLCTSDGRGSVQDGCPDIECVPTHILDQKYGAFDAASHFWPEGRRVDMLRLLEGVSLRAGISDSAWMGFDRLGLAVAFYHGTPDATLPIFHHNGNGWRHLVRKA